MAYKKSFFKDKTIVTLSAISIIAAAALIGGIALDSGAKNDSNSNDTNPGIVDLNESETTQNYTKRDESKEPDTIADFERQSNAETDIEFETDAIPEVPEDISQMAGQENIPLEEESDIIANAPATSSGFTMDSLLTWPVDGNIIIDYDMENTVYFPTLDLYKCSDSICIQSEVGTPVYASADCTVTKVGSNEEIGSYVIVDLGNEYALTYGQLKDIVVNPEDTIESGDLIGYVNAPTDYYTLEGPNLYLQLTESGNPINPLDYLNYE